VNLYLSVLLRPSIAPRAVPVFAFIAPLAIVDVIQDERVTAAVKWPNDVLIERKKIAGTLAEAAARDSELEYVVLGIGVNLNVTRAALQAALGDAGPSATSLREVVGHEIDRNAFAAALLNALDRWLEVYTRRGPATIVAAWQDRDIVTGRRVEVRGDGEPYQGQATGLDGDGRLVVTAADGTSRHVVAGEVRFVD
jgi:BirA family biotin operon repressor/biotin-[acetyl-CoA-carboxylase] ligase